jgi:excisionase family DNA binding protein
MSESESPSLYLTLEEVAELCRVSPMTVRRWIANDQLPAARTGTRGAAKIIVRRADVEEFLWAAPKDAA